MSKRGMDMTPVAWTTRDQLQRVAACAIGFIARPNLTVFTAPDVPLYTAPPAGDPETIRSLLAERDMLRAVAREIARVYVLPDEGPVHTDAEVDAFIDRYWGRLQEARA